MTDLDGQSIRDAIEKGDDIITIKRDGETGNLHWSFDCPRSNAVALLLHIVFHQLMVESGYRARIEELERQVEELKQCKN